MIKTALLPKGNDHDLSLTKKDLDQTLRGWANQAEVFAPQRREGYAQFLPWEAGAELLLDEPHNTRFPPKAFFLPQSETLLTYNRKLSQLEMPALQISPRIIFGIRPCDARAVALLDTVLPPQKTPILIGKRAASKLSLSAWAATNPLPPAFAPQLVPAPLTTLAWTPCSRTWARLTLLKHSQSAAKPFLPI